MQRTDQVAQGQEADGGPDHRGDSVQQGGAGPGNHRRNNDGAHQDHAGYTEHPLPVGDHTEDGGEEDDGDAHANEKCHLVVGAERGDREVLQPRRGEVDEGGAEGDQGRGTGGQEGAKQFCHAQHQAGTDYPS